MTELNGTCALSTGKTFEANNGIIGIGPKALSGGEITEGYDGGIHEEFTHEEKREIADYVIGLWYKWVETK